MEKRFTRERIDNKDLTIMHMIYSGDTKPSIHEMRQRIHARSTGTVAFRLEKLERMGYVTQPAPHQPRSRTITQRGKEVLKGAKLIPDETV
jgi:predicted MarR family transcription regulator